jgi:hypothetical protein
VGLLAKAIARVRWLDVGLLALVALLPPSAAADVFLADAGAEIFTYDGAYVRTNSPAITSGSGAVPAYDGPSESSLSRTAVSAGRLAAKGVPRAGASALEDASQAAFKAAEGPISISRKHLPGAVGRYNKFAEGIDDDSVVREALRSPNAMFRPNPGGGYRSLVMGQGPL